MIYIQRVAGKAHRKLRKFRKFTKTAKFTTIHHATYRVNEIYSKGCGKAYRKLRKLQKLRHLRQFAISLAKST